MARPGHKAWQVFRSDSTDAGVQADQGGHQTTQGDDRIRCIYGMPVWKSSQIRQQSAE